MAVAVVSTTSAQASGASSVTFSHTVSAGTDRAMYVGGGAGAGTVPTVSSVTYNGTGLTEGYQASGQTYYMVFGFYLVAPTVTTANVVATYSGSSTGCAAGAVSMTGVNQSSPVGTIPSTATGKTNTTQTPSIAVTSQTDGLVLDTLYYGYSSLGGAHSSTVGAGQTARYDQDDATGELRCRGSSEPGAASVTMSWTITPGTEGGPDYFPYVYGTIPFRPTRTALNTRSHPLGVNVGMGWRMPA